jgi:hypothetical protein
MVLDLMEPTSPLHHQIKHPKNAVKINTYQRISGRIGLGDGEATVQGDKVVDLDGGSRELVQMDRIYILYL